jgi:hypothetical protein
MKDKLSECIYVFQQASSVKSNNSLNCSPILKINDTVLNKSIEHSLLSQIENNSYYKIKLQFKINITNDEYLKRRKGLIVYLRRLCYACKYPPNIFYQTLNHVDKICLQNSNYKYDLIVIGCLLLTGITS